MRILDYILLTLETTRGNILRTFLSIISVVIGVFSFVFVISLNEGMADNMLETLKNYGGYNTFDIEPTQKNIIITPIPGQIKKKVTFHYPITLELVDSLNAYFPEAVFITEIISYNRVKIEGKKYRLLGINAEYFDFYENIKIKDGRKFNYLDLKNKNNVVIIEHKKNSFNHKLSVGDNITINKYQFEIVGEYTTPNSNYQSGIIFIPNTTFNVLLASPNQRYRSILCKAKDISQINIIKRKVGNYLDLIYSDGLFKITSREDGVKSFWDIASSYSNLILLFSILMLVTGGIGIMNIMLSSIRERMREIGIKKAVGATNKDIFIQFFLETMLLFFIGGSIGIILAVLGVENVAEIIIKKSEWETQTKTLISFKVIITSIIFTGITGFIFGLLPAIKASKVMPIDSLRYE